MLHSLNSTSLNSLPGIHAAQTRAEQSKYLSKRSPWGIPLPCPGVSRVQVFRLAPHEQNWNVECL